jgi:hypothetical protein
LPINGVIAYIMQKPGVFLPNVLPPKMPRNNYGFYGRLRIIRISFPMDGFAVASGGLAAFGKNSYRIA